MADNGTQKKARWPKIYLGHALRLVWKATPKWTAISLLLIIIQVPLAVLPVFLTKLMVDTLTSVLSGPLTGDSIVRLVLIVAIQGGTSLLVTFVSMLQNLTLQIQSEAYTEYMETVLQEKSLALDLEYFENPAYNDVMMRGQSEAMSRPLQVQRNFVQVAQSVLTLLGFVGLLLTLHWSVMIVLFVIVLPGALVQMRFSRRQYSWQREMTVTQRELGYYGGIITNSGFAKEVRLLDLGALFMQRHRDLREKVRRERLRLIKQRTWSSFGITVATQLMIYGAMGVIGLIAIQRKLTMGDFFLYYQAFQSGQGLFRSVMYNLANLYEDNLFLGNFYEYMNVKPKIVEPLNPHPVPNPIQSGFVFDHVSFRYPGTSELVLDDVSLTIRPGEKIALVGENGSGKTTLTKLLCRLYEPSGGCIMLDNIDVREFSPKEFRRKMAVLLQDYAMYAMTARENIWLGDITLPLDSEAIVQAARQAGADEIITGLKKGYDSQLGRMFQDGEELSIGQWQRVALSRAFLRNAPLIILDEPTSSMDALAEFQVFQKIRDLAEGRSVVLISHRFSTVRMADCIYVLDNGRIVEHGDHDSLMRLGGKYAQMYTVQAQRYQ